MAKLPRPVGTLPSLLLTLALAPAAAAQEPAPGTPFHERFALAEDRSALLAELLPGTEDHAYYHGLVAQQKGDLDEAQRWIDAWPRGQRDTERARRLRARQALLVAAKDPEAGFGRLVELLDLDFDDPAPAGQSSAPLASAIGPATVADQRFIEGALDARDFRTAIEHFDELLLRKLLVRDLDERQRAAVLDRLAFPDAPGLMEAVVADLLAQRTPRRFGTRRVHGRLTLAQLRRIGVEVPELQADQAWVHAVLERLMPDEGTSLDDDPEETRAYLDRVLPFVRELPESFASLRLHLLFRALELELETAALSPDTLLDLVRAGGATGKWLPTRAQGLGQPSRLDDAFEGVTPFPAIGSMGDLLDRAFEELLVAGHDPTPFLSLVDTRRLEALMARVELTRPGAQLTDELLGRVGGPAAVERLRNLARLEFRGGSRRRIGVGDDVALILRVKNEPELRVRTFKVDELAWFDAGSDQEPETLDLTGLVPAAERRLAVDGSPMELRDVRVDMPALEGPGTWIVEVAGQRQAARAVIRKGGLRLLPEATAAGHLITVVTETGELCPSPTIRFGGRDYVAEDDGRVWVPFAESDVRRKVLVRGAGRIDRAWFRHRSESYGLSANAFAAPESLVPGERATLLVRARLTGPEGVEAGLDLLDGARVVVRAIRDDGGPVRTVVPLDPVLADAGMPVEVYVPLGATGVQVTVEGKVTLATTGQELELGSSSTTLTVNGGTAGAVRQSLLGRTAAGYHLEVRGVGGEVRPGADVTVLLDHRASKQTVRARLSTDEEGRITLGALAGIARVAIDAPADLKNAWVLPEPFLAGRSSSITVAAGEEVRVPLAPAPTHTCSLLQVRGPSEVVLRDAGALVRREDGWLRMSGLGVGTYRLAVFETGQTARIEVVRGTLTRGRIIGPSAAHRRRVAHGLGVAEVGASGETLRVRIEGATPRTRVHVSSSRYGEGSGLVHGLDLGEEDTAWSRIHGAEISTFGEAHELPEEARYIELRRRSPALVGNMLERPGVLLNPWDVDGARVVGRGNIRGGGSSQHGVGGGAGGRYGSRGGGRARRQGDGAGSRRADLGFLGADGVLLSGLVPGEDGVVEVPLDALGAAPVVQIVALDGTATAGATWLREGAPPALLDRRHRSGSPGDRPTAVRRRTLFLGAGKSLRLPAARGNRARVFGTIGDVYAAYRGTEAGAGIEDFAFLARWHELEPAQKRDRYGEFACHEVHLFLQRKDPEFFQAVVEPYLRNKGQRTFMDDYLLGGELAGYLEPWAFSRLNMLEKILLLRQTGRDAARYAADAEAALAPRAGDATDSEVHPAEAEVLLEEFELTDRNKSDENTEGPTDSPFDPESTNTAIGIGGGLDRARRDRLRERSRSALARSMAETRVYAEQHYFGVRLADQTADLVPPSPFWSEFAAAAAGGCPTSFMAATRSRTEMLLALAVLDLPFDAPEPARERDGEDVIIRPGSRALVLVEEGVPLETGADGPLLVGQEILDGERVVGDTPLATGRRYDCRVTVTNPSPEPRTVRVQAEVPSGAVPVSRGRAALSRTLRLDPWGTAPLSLGFYVPAAGEVSLEPAAVSADGVLIGRADGRTLEVLVDAPEDRDRWDWIARRGSMDDVLRAIESRNVFTLDLGLLAWRMGERTSFERIVGALEGRQVFVPALWRYALRHGDGARARRFLEASDELFDLVGGDLAGGAASFDAPGRRAFEHLSFAPLEAPRVLPIGDRPRVDSERFQTQWHRVLDRLALAPSKTAEDRLALTELMIVQRRIPEAFRIFDSIDTPVVTSRLQYDYMDAWLRFSRGDWRGGRDLAARHGEHPVKRWRTLFRGVLAQAAEIDGTGEGPALERTQDRAAGEEPLLGVRAEGDRLEIDHLHLDRVEVCFHRVDVEALFSSDPFGDGQSAAFGLVEPELRMRLDLEPGKGSSTVEVPAALGDADLLVEVRGGGLSRRVRRTSGGLSVQPIERYGEVRVVRRGSRDPLPRAYVKVYARGAGGRVRFHKDGYTDLRGRFDYARRSDGSASRPRAFVALVLADGVGAQVVELRPPAR